MNVKTVVIINDFNYIQGGASKIAIETARMLMESGIKVYFFSAKNKLEENIKGVEYIYTNQQETLKERNKLKGAINGIYNLKAKNVLKELLKKLDKETTIIHVHGWTKALSSSVFHIAFKMKFKIVLTLHDYFIACPNGGYFNYKKNKSCYIKPLTWKCIKCNCDSRNYGFKLYRVIRQFVQNKIVKLNDKIKYVISISDFSENILSKTLNNNTNIKRIFNPIEIDNENIVQIKNNNYFLFVGRTTKDKGVDIFCKAISDLNLKGIVVGDGDEKEKLQIQYPNIEFVGWKNKEEVKEYMVNAKALIFPSKAFETAGLSALEAQALGVPTLVSKNIATQEFIIDNYNGLLFEYGDVESLKEAILKCSDKKIEELSKNAYENYWKNLNFSSDNYKENLINYFNEII